MSDLANQARHSIVRREITALYPRGHRVDRWELTVLLPVVAVVDQVINQCHIGTGHFFMVVTR